MQQEVVLALLAKEPAHGYQLRARPAKAPDCHRGRPAPGADAPAAGCTAGREYGRGAGLSPAARPQRAAGRIYVELVFYSGLMPPEPPYCPPVVGMASGPVGHLLCWDRHERDGSWWAWVSWIQESSSRPVHKLVCVPAASLTQLETPDAYRQVPRRVFGRDGRVRPWSRAAAPRGRPPVV